MKKNFLAIFFMLMSLLVSFSMKGQGSLIDKAVLTNITITDDHDQSFTPENPPHTNSNVRIYLDWALDNSWGVQDGDYYIYQVPPFFSVHNTVSGGLFDNVSNINYGTFHLANDGKLTITFNSNAENKDVTGKIFLETSFNQMVITKEDTIRTGIEDEFGDEILIIIGFKEGSIQKTGALDGNNNIKWVIKINSDLDLVTNAVLIDTIPAGLNFEDWYLSPSGYKTADLDLLDDGRKVLIITWDKIDKKEIELRYYTSILNPSIGTFTNSAKFFGENILPAYTHATVNVDAATLDKKLLSYDAANGKMNWQIQYYANTTNASLTDQLWTTSSNKGTHYLISGSVKAYTVDVQGNETSYGGFNLINEEMVDGHVVKFKVDLQNNTAPVLFRINYSTQATVFPILTTTNFQNIVTDNEKDASGEHRVEITTIEKVHNSTNYADSTHLWTTTINKSQIRMRNLVLVDTFQTAGMTFIESSLTIKANGSNLIKGSDYTVTAYNGNYQKGFVVTFQASYTDTKATFTLSYATKFDINAIPSGASRFTNRSIAKYTDNNNTSRKESASAFATISSTIKANGSKSGIFIPRGKTYAAAPFNNGKEYTSTTQGSILWNVAFNYNNLTIKNAVFTDALIDKQQYADGTLQVWTMSVKNDGSLNRDILLTEGSDYTFTNVSGNSGAADTVKIIFTNNITGPIGVYFITTLDNALQQKESYDNTAELTSSSQNKYTWKATVKTTKTSNWVQKEGRQGDESKGEDPFKIYWSVLVNKDSAIVENAVLRDSLDSKQKLVTDSHGKLAINVYNVKLSGSNFVKDETSPLTEDLDFTVDYTPAGATGSEKFALKFINPNPITRPYIVEYRSQILVANNDVITNHVSFTGASLTPMSTTQTITIKLTSGQGEATGQGGSITIKKVCGVDGHALPNATFYLYNQADQIIRTLTTDENGEIKATNLSFVTYILKEIKAPKGYRLDGVARQVTLSGAKPDTVLTITNTPKSSIARLLTLKANSDNIEVGNESHFSYTLKCDVHSAFVEGTAVDNGTVWFEGSTAPNQTTIPDITKAGVTYLPFKVISEDSTQTAYYSLDITHPFNSDIIVQMWDEVLTPNNNELTNGGYSFAAFQWYKNDVLLLGETGNLLRVPEKLKPVDAYHAVLTTTTGWSAPSCPMHPVNSPSDPGEIIAYPNPVQANHPINIKTGLKEDHSEKATLYIYDLQGKLVYTQIISGPEALVKAPGGIGNYVLKLKTTEGSKVKPLSILVTP